jgi:CheY-like chemotaxis protein
VVEDDAWIRKAVGRALQAAGFEVLLVPTVADALIVAQRSAFQVLVLDLHLPDGSDPFHGIYDGFAMLDWLQRQLGALRFSTIVHTSKRRSMACLPCAIKQRDLTKLAQCVSQAIESNKVAASSPKFAP